MRWVYLVITVVLVLAMIVFALQNLDLVTMSFLHFSVSAPLAVLVVVVYVLGAVAKAGARRRRRTWVGSDSYHQHKSIQACWVCSLSRRDDSEVIEKVKPLLFSFSCLASPPCMGYGMSDRTDLRAAQAKAVVEIHKI